MNKKIKLVVADIDMTLRSDPRIFPELNTKAINDLHKNGYLFGMASGRSTKQILAMKKDFNLDFDMDLAIGVNGSSMYDGLDKIDHKYLLLDHEWVKDIIALLRKVNKEFYFYINDETVFSSASNEYYKQHYVAAGRPASVASKDEDFLYGDVYKGLVEVKTPEEKKEMEDLFAPLLEKRKGQIKLLMTTKTCMEFVHYETSKGYALKKFCDTHNIGLDEVAAFGDAENDNEMIDMSGMGVCLKNGSDSTLKIADFVTDLTAGEGGFGDFVYKHILNKE